MRSSNLRQPPREPCHRQPRNSGAGVMNTHYGLPAAPLPSPQRRRFPVQPPLITTAVGGAPASNLSSHFGSPYSAAPPLSPMLSAAPSGSNPMALRTSSSPMVTAYNPQAWGRSGPVAGAYVPYSSSTGPVSRSTRDITGMEGNYQLFVEILPPGRCLPV